LETREAVIAVAAILNKHGRGELFFGVRRDGEVLGQTVSDSTVREVDRALRENIRPRIDPAIELVNIDNKDCLRVRFEGEDAPYLAFDKAFIRAGDECRSLTPAQIETFPKREPGPLPAWDSEDSDQGLEDINTNFLRSFMKRAHESGRLDYKFTDRADSLRRLGLLEGGRLANAAIAMFGKKPRTGLQMAIFATDVQRTYIDLERRTGTIIELVDIGEKYVRSNMRWRVVIDGSPRRREVPEVPVMAIREALRNSFTHRDFRAPEANEVAIFRDRIEISNPGAFPEGLTPRDLIEGDGRPPRRNPLLARVMSYSKDIEGLAGLRLIARECEAAGVHYGFALGRRGFSVSFYRPDTAHTGIGPRPWLRSEGREAGA
jgi:ATP-dependent DNA helicase RecG